MPSFSLAERFFGAPDRFGVVLPLLEQTEHLCSSLSDAPCVSTHSVLRNQLKATKEICDVNAKTLIEIPDEKIRQDAALAILAYNWGRPVERKMVEQGRLRDMKELLARLDSWSICNDSGQTKYGAELIRILQTAAGLRFS